MGAEGSKAADANGAGGQRAKPRGALGAFDCRSVRPGRHHGRLALERVRLLYMGRCKCARTRLGDVG